MDRVYPARVIRIVDGDTVVADVDLGFGIYRMAQTFRLLGCNAREHTQSGGMEARAHLVSLMPAGTVVTLTSVKNDKFGGRYDATITLPDGQDLVLLLVATGWVAAWDGVGVKPIPPWPRPMAVREVPTPPLPPADVPPSPVAPGP